MKNYIITLGISLLIGIIVTIVVLMTNIPQIDTDDLGSVKEYNGIVNSDYKFENYKNISEENAKKDYVITSDQINKFIYTNSYNPGNTNPFTPKEEVDGSVDDNNNEDTDDKTDNSNNGQGNNSNTGK